MLVTTRDRPVPDDEAVMSSFHDDRLRFMLGLPDDHARAEAATAYISRLDAFRADAIAIRDVSVYRLHKDHGLGALRMSQQLGVTKARGQQLIYRASETYQSASQVVAKIKRRLGRG